MKEEWKDIIGFEGLYQISNYGRVKSLNYNHSNEERIMKLSVGTKGYLQVCLTKNNRRSTKRIHRLVAEAFIPNPLNLETVNHIDEVKTNNHFSNLEWCTFEYNTKYGTRAERCGNPVMQFSKLGEYITTYVTSKDAERKTGIDHSHILACCSGKYGNKTAGGYVWKFERGESLRIK